MVPFKNSRLILILVAIMPAVLLSPGAQAVFAGLSFSGDVALNSGSPTGPVIVGRQSIGSLQLDNGTVFSSGVTQFGINPTGIGRAMVTGPRTSWSMGTTEVGLAGIGQLDIEQGAVVETMRMMIGTQTGGNGRVYVDGAGSTLQVRGPMTVGGVGTTAGIGQLEISNGAIVNATQTQNSITRSGRVVLDGGLLRMSAVTYDGLISGSGEVQFMSSAMLNVGGRLEVGPGDRMLVSGMGTPLQNVGMIAVDGGELEILRPVSNSRLGTLTPGEVTLRNGTMRVGGTSVDGMQFTGAGLLAAIGGENHFYGRVQITSDPRGLGGEIAVANNSVLVFHDDVSLQSGMMTVFAGSKATLLEDLTLASGSQLLADIAGSSADTEYGEIEVVGNVQLGGQLLIALSDGFTPAAGDSFQIIKALGGITGELTLGQMPQLPDQLVWDLDISANHVTLNVVHALSGDYNGNGVVDAADYVVWRNQGGTPETYDIWRANFGEIAVGSPSLTSVPEPATWLLMIGATSLLMLRRRSASTCQYI